LGAPTMKKSGFFMSYTTLWRLFLATACFQMLGSFLYFVVFDDGVAIQVAYFITKIVMFGAPLALLYAGFSLPRFSLRPNFGTSLALGLGSGLMIAALMLGTYFLFANFFTQFASTILNKVTDVGILHVYWPAVTVIALFHSLFEEYYVRWYLVKGFETRLSPVASILIANGLFTLHHYIILSQFVSWPIVLFCGTFVGVGGCIWSYIYHRTGSLLGAWLSHICADIAVFIIGYLLIT
jgi:membrane protease YdiL (CAAX protease family)